MDHLIFRMHVKASGRFAVVEKEAATWAFTKGGMSTEDSRLR